PRVEAPLAPPIELETRLGDFDGQNRARGMGETVVVRAAGNDCDIRLRLRVVVEPDRALRAHGPPGPECLFQDPRGFLDCRVVRGALGLGDHQLSADQFDGLPWLEHAERDEPLILNAVEGPRPDVVQCHPQASYRRGLRASTSRNSYTP